jgi:hypothetical protein
MNLQTESTADPKPGEPPPHGLAGTLQSLLVRQDGQAVSIGELFEQVGEKGFGLCLILLSLPSALPVPAAGYSVPFGFVLFVLGVQMILGRRTPSLPGWAARRTLSPGLTRRMANGAAWLFGHLERFIRPRMSWIGLRGGRLWMGVVVVLMATLMMIPIPTTNTFPAFVIFLIGVGLSEEDGLFGVFAMLVGVFAIALYVFITVLLVQFIGEYGWAALDQFKDWLKETVRSFL